MYLGLSVLACWSMHAEVKQKWYFIVMLFAISWGILMEIFQFSMHLGRSFDVFDILANSVGVITGISIYILLSRLKKTIDNKKGVSSAI